MSDERVDPDTSTRMNLDVRDRWVTALRSGHYRQGHGKLRRVSSAGDELCCLGVLCELAAEAGVVRRMINFDVMTYVGVDHPSDASSNFLPAAVQDWAGLRSGNPVVAWYELADWNDERHASFARIADLIEENL